MLLSERISSHLFYYPVHHIAYFLATVQVCTSRVGAAGQIRQFISYKKPSLGESYRMVIYVTGFRFEGTQFYNLIQFPADPGTFLFRIGGNFIKSLPLSHITGVYFSIIFGVNWSPYSVSHHLSSIAESYRCSKIYILTMSTNI